VRLDERLTPEQGADRGEFGKPPSAEMLALLDWTQSPEGRRAAEWRARQKLARAQRTHRSVIAGVTRERLRDGALLNGRVRLQRRPPTPTVPVRCTRARGARAAVRRPVRRRARSPGRLNDDPSSERLAAGVAA